MAGEVKWYENQVLAEIAKVKRSALNKIGAMVAKDARALCPVGIEIKFGKKVWKEREPGTLRASIRHIIVKKGTGVQVIAGSKKALISKGWKSKTDSGKRFMGRDPFHARFVEFGTSRMAARPFMRPAMHKNYSKIMAAFHGILK